MPIPLELLFGHPDVQDVTISPDGRWLAMIRPYEGVANVWVAPREDPGRLRPLTTLRGRGVQAYRWTYDGRRLLTLQDADGDENWRVYAVDLHDGNSRLLTPAGRVQARIEAVSPHRPDEVLVALNHRDPRWHDLYRVHLASGQMECVAENTMEATRWLVDEHLSVRGYYRMRPDGGAEVVVARDGTWHPLLRWGVDDVLTTEPLAVRGDTLYLQSTLTSDTAQLQAVDLGTGEVRRLAAHPHYDVGMAARGPGLLFAPGAETPFAVAVSGAYQRWIVLDAAYQSAFDALDELADGRHYFITGQDLEGRHWTVAVEGDRQSVHYYLVDRKEGHARLLYRARPALERFPLQARMPFRFTARDGLAVEGYFTGPADAPSPPPLVAYVHGGPWHRDHWGFEPIVQWLADRGFAVVQVNFRGSTGYGREFIRRSAKEWGGRMLDDVIDGIEAVLVEGKADPRRVSIMGGSFGGYSTLAGLAFYPERFRSGVDLVGPSNLFTFLAAIPPYWEAYRTMLYHYVGHPEDDAELLRRRSPYFHADRISAPLLVAQGANDPRVKRQESLQIVDSLRRRGHPVEYVEYADEGHGFAKPENRLDFFRRAERFLGRHGR